MFECYLILKELSISFELIVNSLFGFDTGLNLTQNDRNLLIWPLKTINRYNKNEYNSTYRFLSTDSIFWATLFKLSNLQVNFKFPINFLPNYIRYRIENELSILAQRVDTMGHLNLSKLTKDCFCFTKIFEFCYFYLRCFRILSSQFY
jgi:hypothetical protein